MEVVTSVIIVGSTKNPFFKCCQIFVEYIREGDRFRKRYSENNEKQWIPQDELHHTEW